MSGTPSFDELGLRPELLRAVADAGYTIPTPIQAQAIPTILQGLDVMGGAQTGTGKTAGFALPILQKLLPLANASPSPARHPVRALILTPTRELAIQVEEAVKTYGKYTGIRSTVVYGGVDIRQQLPVVRGGIEILVATPGRLLDHIEQKSVNLSHVEIFVLDEADRMLDMGFIPDIKRIMALLPATAKRQNLLFSATFSNEIKKLADQLLNAPTLIEVALRNTAAETVAQSVYKLASDQKRALLTHIVTSRNLWQVLCFVRTKHGASRLARQLEKDGLKTTAIHGDKSQAARLEALDDFKAAKVQVMVATDVAARGLDIDDLPLVVNYEMPYVPEDYIHRIGRTGRAGAAGQAISLCAPDEEKLLAEIERMLKRTIPVATLDGLPPHRQDPSTHQPSAARQTREVRETRGTKRPAHAATPASHSNSPASHSRSHASHSGSHAPRRERAADADDRNPDQAPVSRVTDRNRVPSPLVLTGTATRPSLHRKHPIPALLMKRSVREPEKV
jgi:ATP-dependent RNA helicase RhlE